MNELKYWNGGVPWGTITITANDPGTQKYWNDGILFGEITPTSGSPTINTNNFFIWFF